MGGEHRGPRHGRGGRPRSPDRDEAILAATLDLLDSVGYDRMRVQDIATRAGVGLATLYRRWRTKQELVVAALRRARERVVAAPPTRDAHQDLVVMIEGLVREMRASSPAFLPGLLAAVHGEPEIAAAVRDEIIAPLRARFRDVLSAAVGQDLDAHDVRVDAAPALLLFRILFDAPRAANAAQLATEIRQLVTSGLPDRPSAEPRSGHDGCSHSAQE